MKTIQVILISFILTGCGLKEVEYLPTIVEKEVYVPYVPEIPSIDCQFTGDSAEIIKQMLNCITLHKKVLNSLRIPNQYTTQNITQKGGINATYDRK